jgi:N-acetylmuramoyl-L-alanine amidase
MEHDKVSIKRRDRGSTDIARRFRQMLILTTFSLVLSLISAPVVVAQSIKPAGETTVHGLRVGVHGDKTRLVMDMDGPASFKTFVLADPYRIVIDLPEVKFRIPTSGKSNLVGGVAGYRFGLFEPGTSRVVFDLAEPRVIAAAFELPPWAGRGHRLVMDLRKVTRASFMNASKASIAKRVSERGQDPPSSLAPDAKARRDANPGAGKTKKVIVIDPGHGGVDPGAIGASGSYEKTITLAAAKTLKRVLEKTGRYEVVLTRSRDRFLRLRQRVAVSRASEADLFISVHADSIADKRLRGASIYTLSEQSSDKEAARLAEQENKSDIIAGMDFSEETPEVTNILIDLAQRETMNQSARFAGYLAKELRGAVRTHRRAHRFAGFAVLKAPDVPSVLLELGYLSNPEEERMLRSPVFQNKVAVALKHGIDRYFETVQAAAR